MGTAPSEEPEAVTRGQRFRHAAGPVMTLAGALMLLVAGGGSVVLIALGVTQAIRQDPSQLGAAIGLPLALGAGPIIAGLGLFLSGRAMADRARHEAARPDGA